MEAHKQLTIGLFGFGVVGEGLYRALQQTPSLKATIKKVCIKNTKKKRNAPASLFTVNKNEILMDKTINVIVEVIDDADAAFKIVSFALKNGKAVVSANKKMIAEHLAELLDLQKEFKQSFLYEAAACASIPVIRNLEEYYDNDLLHSFKAIVNGSTNFILTKMFEDKLAYRDALVLAKQLGFAESNPVLDVEGYDAVNKLSILLNHAYGIVENPSNILFTGIQNITQSDAAIAKEKHYSIKLVAQAMKLNDGKVAAFVLPQFVKEDEHLSYVKNENNGVQIESGFADTQFFFGKGAGSLPTASAIISDISALRYDYRYEYKKLYHHIPHLLSNDFYLRVYVSFKEVKYIPIDKFKVIEERHEEKQRKYIVGVINVKELLNGNWWKDHQVSLIFINNVSKEDLNLLKFKKLSMELYEPGGNTKELLNNFNETLIE